MATNNTENFDRKQAIERANSESERSDYKQHAMKMLRDFEKFNDFSSNRAIWELVQNACDLTTNCEIIVDYRDGKFAFTHNGRPFTTNALISLIKQVSGDKDGESDIPPVGKYGTGFLTTHSLGRKFEIDSLLETAGNFLKIEKFMVDRSHRDWQDLRDAIWNQKEKALNILATGELIENPEFQTTFTYLPATDQETAYIANSYRDLEAYVPIVLTINNRLKSFTVISAEGVETKYAQLNKRSVHNDQGIHLYQTTILKNKDEQVLYSITDDANDKNKEIEIILPIDKDHQLMQFSDRVARLFLYYPLVGSEHFGINFIINCTLFLPTEPRDGIHLQSNKDQVKDQERVNRELIDKASALIIAFLKSNVISVQDPLLYAEINFKRDSGDPFLDSYFTKLQQTWIQEFIKLPIVTTTNGYKTVPEVVLLNPVMLQSEKHLDCIDYLLRCFFDNAPTKETITAWSRFVANWHYQDANFIDDEMLAKQLNGMALSAFEEIQLSNYYNYLIEAKQEHLFNIYELIPNLDGQFQALNALQHAKDLDPALLSIGKELIPQSIALLLNERFAFDFNFRHFSRKDFSNDVNAKLNEVISDLHVCLPITSGEKSQSARSTVSSPVLNFCLFTSLLRYCRLHTQGDSQSKPVKLMRLISEHYALNGDVIQIEAIPELDDDINIRPAQRKAAKVFFNSLLELDALWVENHLQFLNEVLSCYEDRYKDVYTGSKIYPNQLFELKLLYDLKKDVNLDNELVILYNAVVKKEIKDDLAHKDFNHYLTTNEEITNRFLSTNIENAFLENDIQSINEHPFKNEILSIIARINQAFYKELFPRLDDKKANLMLEVVTNENTKDHIFSIVTLKEYQLAKLGEIIKEGNLDQVIKKAEEIILQEKRKRSDFQHKYIIGTYIENKIRNKINSELAQRFQILQEDALAANDVQGGQDIIIHYDKIAIYFLEVKSRWDSNNSISMSKLQLQRASENANRYALISVDITKYQGHLDIYQLPEAEVLPLAKVVKTIGHKIEPLIKENLLAEADPTSPVTLNDYRGIINQETIQQGDKFEVFVDALVEHLHEIITDMAK